MKKSELRKLIRNVIKEQDVAPVKPMIGDKGSGVSTAGRSVVVRPCDHSPNGSVSFYPVMQNMTIDGVAPQVGDVFFYNAHTSNLSGNGISGGQQSKWEVISVNSPGAQYSTTYDRVSISCDQPIYGTMWYTSIPAAANPGDPVYFRCAVSNQYSQTPGVSQGCLPTTSGPYTTMAECEATGCAPGTVNDPDGDGYIDPDRMNIPKKMQAPIRTPIKKR